MSQPPGTIPNEGERSTGRTAASAILWQAAFDAISQAACLLDAEGNTLACNRAMAELLRRAPEEVVGQPFEALAEAVLGPLELPTPARAPHSERRTVTELPIGERWFRATTDPVQDDRGTLSGTVLMLADITDRKQSEEALIAGEERFRTISELTSDYAFAYQIFPDGRVVRQWTTGAFQRLTGYTPEELDALGWKTLQHPEDEPRFAARLAAMNACQPDVREWRIVTKSGETRWMRDSARSIRDDATGTIQVYGASQDITERRQAEARLQSTMAHGRYLLWYAIVERDPFCPRDYYWSLTVVDEEAAQRFLPVEILPGEVYAEAWHRSKLPEDRERMEGSFREALEGRRDAYSQEFRCRTRSGEVRWLREDVSVEPLPHLEDRQRWHLVGICTDITARKHTETEHLKLLAHEQQARAAAELAQQRLAFLADASTLLSTSLDYETTLRLVAPLVVPHLADWCIIDLVEADGMLRRLAVAHADPSKQELVRELLQFPPDPNGSEPVPTVLRTAQSVLHADVTDETLVTVSRGPEHLRIMRALAPRSAMGVPIRARGHTLGVITFMAAESGRRYGPEELQLAEDLAHRVALAVDNARLYKEAQETDRLKDEFLGMLAHELRNPLAAISNAAHLLALRQPADPALQRHRGVLERQVKQMARLLDDLLDVSRITRGKIELRPEVVDMGALVEQALEACQSSLVETPHEVALTLPPEPVRLQADPARLLQVLGNLLSNAIRYTEPGGRIAVTVGQEPEGVVVRIRDTGVGISAEMLPLVFDLFVQADRSLDRSQGGLGVGLTIAQRLAELHGGRITVSSDGPGRGSEFVLRLPAEPLSGDRRQTTAPDVGRPAGATGAEAMSAEAAPASRPEPSSVACRLSSVAITRSAGTRLPPAAKRVLVVDDNADAAESMADVLDLLGYEARMACDGPTALEAARSYQPAVVLLDIGLPGMNGYEVALRLREQAHGQRLLLVALSGYSAQPDRQRAEEVGFDRYLTKPVELSELERLLATVEKEQHPV